MPETIDFIGEIHPLITQFREMSDRHRRDADQYRDSNGAEPTDDQRCDSALIAHAREAAELLDTVMERLSELCGPPLPGHAHTLTFAGPERHDGEAPYLFVVNGQDLPDARRNLGALPSFREWFEEQRAWDEPGSDPDVVFLSAPADSRPGLPNSGFYNELRREQAVLWDAESVAPELAARLPELEG
ncbi:hypothetical protein [Streptomyces yaizuensis]|uniref:Uncharacterized protein n=1 Tax=Streptomyces yaizuensis TaxID=2989713 RepID=A0ABQ5P6M2_9ACTN|nr:hypothetical protein [Streptomyces sp. YSPA8]GLF98212.1 hypothetical protein SYYSPA8_27965 [Streptomyces sp. YSPA8]